jgi:hypothetical protein
MRWSMSVEGLPRLSVCVPGRVVIDMDVLLTSVGKSMISILNIHVLNSRPTHSKS